MADLRPRPWDSAVFAFGLIALFGVLYATLARFALDAFPYSGDEYSLALQGELLARGHVKATGPGHLEWLRVDHVVIDDFVRSKYPPGAPALLALGVRAGAAWLVTPLEGVAALAVVWHTTRRLLGRREALVALIAMGLAPLFAFNAASFYAHTATTLFLAIAFAAACAWTGKRRDGWLVLAGAAIGCAFLTRPIDAILFGLAMVSLRSWRAVVITAACAVPFVLANLVYQDAAFGSYFTDGYHAYEPTFRLLYGADTAANPISLAHLVSPVQQWNHLDVYRAMIVDWTVPGTAIVALFGAFAITKGHPARPIRNFSLAIIGVYCVALLAMIADPDDGARPRYLSNLLVPLAVLTGAGFAPTCAAITAKFGRRIKRLMVAAAILLALGQLASFLQERIPKVWKREGLYQVVAAAQLQNAVVIVRAQYPSRFARNGPFFDGPVLYLSAPPTTTAQAIAAAYPDRSIWEAHEGEPWTLVHVR